jgi:hypothetical protein
LKVTANSFNRLSVVACAFAGSEIQLISSQGLQTQRDRYWLGKFMEKALYLLIDHQYSGQDNQHSRLLENST